MAKKFSTEPILNRSGKARYIDLKRGNNAAYLHNLARFGMLGGAEIQLLHGIHSRSAYFTIQNLKASNNAYIEHIDYQAKRQNRMWSVPLYYELTAKGKAVNYNRDVPDYEPLAGSDFEHRAMTVRWMVSLYAGVMADKSKRFIEWPEIRARLPKNFKHGVVVNDKRIQTDWRPFGFCDIKANTYRFTRGPEIDCATEQLAFSRNKSSTIENKLIAHAEILRNRLYTSVGIPNDFIPFVTTTTRRKDAMKQHLAQLIDEGHIRKQEARSFGFAVFPAFDSDEPLDTRAYTMPYERVGYPDFQFNKWD